MSELVHLHRHSEFSLLDGLGTAEMYAARAAELNQAALAITDHGSLAGTLYHVEACEEHGVKPILGMEGYFRQDIDFDRENKRNNDYFHLILLAKNLEGWTNLIRLSSLSFQPENFYQKPCIDLKLLRKYSGGLIASTSCVSGIVPRHIIRDSEKDARRHLNVFLDIFGDDFYLEIQPHDFAEQNLVNLTLMNWSQEMGIPTVATSDVHFPYEDWHDTQDVLVRTRLGNEVELNVPETCWLATDEELLEQFSKYQDNIPQDFVRSSIANSTYIANKIEHFKIDKSPKIPKATRSPLQAERILRQWCQEGLERIGKTEDEVYLARLEEELSVLKKLKVLDYFVIVGDMVRWAKNQQIRVGPGRGSAVGCLVNYLIKITAIDPIGYGLLFERFMNEYRTELPDIDIDFQDDRRDEVKDYLREKWGKDYVVDIVAFQSFGLKAAIKDVVRVLNIPYAKAHAATESIPDKTWGMDLEDIERDLPLVRELFEEYPELRRHSLRLHGQMKAQSKHAAAVIVTDRPAQDIIPMMKSKDGGMVTQWSERANAQLISPYGFLKIDCLATDGLTVQDKACRLIKERHGIDIDFEDLNQFSMIESPLLSEEDVVFSFADGALLGIFQFQGSSGMKGFLKKLKPTNLEHLIAANAMYRPGPMAFLDEYSSRKNGAKWELFHPSLEPYLGYTYGVLVFQEQVMQMYRALAKDASTAEAAVFQKVVSKGIARDLAGKEKMQKYYTKFYEGCRDKGISKEACDQVWKQILEMSIYSFNKSHSAGYAAQGYQDKWLKKRFPLEYYTALLTVDSDNAKKIPPIIKESKLFGIKVLQPDVNTSGRGFTIDNNNIRFGLLAIKYVSDVSAREVIANRSYDTYDTFYNKVPKNKVNKRVKKFLLSSGAFDTLGGRREWILDDEALPIEGSYSEKEMAEMEKEAIGFSISKKTDVDAYKKLISERIDTADELMEKEDEAEALVGGEIVKLKEIETKKGDNMAFADLEFADNEYAVTIFPEPFRKYRHMLSPGNAILVIGEWDVVRKTVVAQQICTASQLAEDLKRNK